MRKYSFLLSILTLVTLLTVGCASQNPPPPIEAPPATTEKPTQAATLPPTEAPPSTPTPTPIVNPTVPVSPSITISQDRVIPGKLIKVTGSGFSPSEENITVIYDGQEAVSGILANPSGVWGITFIVPPSAAGNHTIDAYGPITRAASVPDITVTVTPGFFVSSDHGPPGRALLITGYGFVGNEKGISLTYDGMLYASGSPGGYITANSLGSWETTMYIAAMAVSGPHVIGAYGSITPAEKVPTVTFTVIGGM